MRNVLLQPAYVLHRRPYRESSFLVELLTPEYGRLTVVAKGVRKARSAHQGLLQPFTALWVSWVGKGELMTLTQVEMNTEGQRSPYRLQGECLFAGFYLNELLMSLLQKWDAHPTLYGVYEKTLAALQTERLEEKTLRSFEKNLLEELGYGLFSKSDLSLHNTFAAEKYYRFIPDQGFVISELGDMAQAKSNIFSGRSLLAIAREDWQEADSLQDAKRLTRFLLASLLGTRPLYSRQLFMPFSALEESSK